MKKNINIERILNPKFSFSYPIEIGGLCHFSTCKNLKGNVENNIFYLNAHSDKEGNLFYKLWRKKFIEVLTGGNKTKERFVMDTLNFPATIFYREVL